VRDNPAAGAAGGTFACDVVSAGLHPRVRSGAAGTHYSSIDVRPLVPGFDGVGRTEDGCRVIFGGMTPPPDGMMAERLTRPRRTPRRTAVGGDDVTVAAAMTPAVSAWLALIHRSFLKPRRRRACPGRRRYAG
jgi:NADPH:quinone reductase-like Zn-dependent oxidoreductase